MRLSAIPAAPRLSLGWPPPPARHRGVVGSDPNSLSGNPKERAHSKLGPPGRDFFPSPLPQTVAPVAPPFRPTASLSLILSATVD